MTEWAKGKVFTEKGGCKEDCFNCPYPDCYKPSRQINVDKTIRMAKSDSVNVEVSTKMYTTVLGKYAKIQIF